VAKEPPQVGTRRQSTPPDCCTHHVFVT